MEEYNLYVINSDTCPESDKIIVKEQCGKLLCDYYKGFEMYLGQPCVRCSYYQDIKDNNS